MSAGGSLVVVAVVSKVRGGIFSTVGTTTSRTGSPTNCRDSISVETSGATSVSADGAPDNKRSAAVNGILIARAVPTTRSEEHTSELQSLMRISYAVS